MKRRVLSWVLVCCIILSAGLVPLPAAAFCDSGVVIAAGAGTTFYIKADGSLWGFGDNEVGQVGNGTSENDLTEPVKIMDNVKSVSSGQSITLAVKKDGTLWGWGNARYAIGGKQSLVPIQLLEDVDAVAVSNADQAYAIKTDGTLWTRGDNSALDQSTTFDKNAAKLAFVPVPYKGKVKFVASSSNTLFITAEDELWGWGLNNYGTLGLGNDTEIGVPTKIAEEVATVSTYNNNTMIVKLDGSLWQCGQGNNSDFYDGTTIIQSDIANGYVMTPVHIMDDVLAVAQRQNNFFVIKRDNTLWGWGDNRLRVMVPEGISTLSVDKPIQFMSGVHAVSLGERHLVVAKTDNTVWTGGENYRGGISGEIVGKTTAFPMRQTASGLVDAPAAWALAEVREAEWRKLVPPDLQNGYAKTVTRSEFCTLAITCIEQVNEMTIDAYLTSKGLSLPVTVPFSDIGTLTAGAQKDILAAFTLGIVNGTKPGLFEPANPVTREQGAKMMTATATALGKPTDAAMPSFGDDAVIGSWAKPFIGYVYNAGIMTGSAGKFSPKGSFQRQQAYMTMLRLYKLVTGIQ